MDQAGDRRDLLYWAYARLSFSYFFAFLKPSSAANSQALPADLAIDQTGDPIDLPVRVYASLSEGAPLNSSGYGEERRDSKMYALVTPQSRRAGDGGSSSTGTLVPPLWLDSGATHHVVSDDRILSNLRDPPARMLVTVADGSKHPVTKVGDIKTPDIKITDVYLVPELKMDLVSVRQLAKSKIVTTFYENHAELWLEGTQIGGAIIDDAESLYRLRFLQTP